ncbi:MAG: hypothetical protein I8H94_02390, partial [Rhodobacteraceae bacterium]|nr:hypothetical protein [Paracoccaceae bacterium]
MARKLANDRRDGARGVWDEGNSCVSVMIAFYHPSGVCKQDKVKEKRPSAFIKETNVTGSAAEKPVTPRPVPPPVAPKVVEVPPPASPRPAPAIAAPATPAEVPVRSAASQALPKLRHRMVLISFIVAVMIPPIIAAVYLWGFAADQYN